MAKNTHLILRARTAIEVDPKERKNLLCHYYRVEQGPNYHTKEIRSHNKFKHAGGYSPCIVHKDCKHNSTQKFFNDDARNLTGNLFIEILHFKRVLSDALAEDSFTAVFYS